MRVIFHGNLCGTGAAILAWLARLSKAVFVVSDMRVYLQKYFFLIGLVVALALAALNPGRYDYSGLIAKWLVAGIFFLSGFALPSRELLKSFRSFRTHFLIQFVSFALAPVLVWITLQPLRGLLSEAIIAGLCALACLPTTISSCVAFTHAAGGNTGTALFNAALGNAMGVMLTPILLTFMLGSHDFAMGFADMTRVWRSLALQLVLPFLGGQGVRLLFAAWSGHLRSRIMVLTNLFLLCLVFLVFAEAFASASLRAAFSRLPLLFIYSICLHLALLMIAAALARCFGLSIGERVAVIFTAPQKTLSMGVPLITAYFSGNPELTAVAMVPLLFYHPMQLFAAALIVGRLRASLKS